MIAESKVTIFNRVTNRETDSVTSKKTILSCHWEGITGKTNSTAARTNQQSADTASIFIPFIQPGLEKEYVTPEMWRRLPEEERDGFFTFADEDIVLKGEVEEDIPENGYRDFIRKNPGALLILKTETMDYGSLHMRHWELTCA